MSRGYGRVQRAILETLSDQRGLSTADITRRVYGHRQAHCGTLPMAETAAVSRALAGLKRGGLVKVTYSGESAYGTWRYGSRWKLA